MAVRDIKIFNCSMPFPLSSAWKVVCCFLILGDHIGFTKYQKWCRKHGYNFSQDKALDIYASACGHFGVMPKTDTTKLLVEQAVSQLRATATALASLKREMQSLVASLPEHPVVMEMFGVARHSVRNSWQRLVMFIVSIPRKLSWLLRALMPLHTSLDSWIFTAEASPNGVLPRCAERCSL